MFSAGPIVVCVRTLNTQVSSGKVNSFGLYDTVKGAEWEDGGWRPVIRRYLVTLSHQVEADFW